MTRVTGLASSLELTRVIFLCYFLIDFKKNSYFNIELFDNRVS